MEPNNPTTIFPGYTPRSTYDLPTTTPPAPRGPITGSIRSSSQSPSRDGRYNQFHEIQYFGTENHAWNMQGRMKMTMPTTTTVTRTAGPPGHCSAGRHCQYAPRRGGEIIPPAPALRMAALVHLNTIKHGGHLGGGYGWQSSESTRERPRLGRMAPPPSPIRTLQLVLPPAGGDIKPARLAEGGRSSHFHTPL